MIFAKPFCVYRVNLKNEDHNGRKKKKAGFVI